MSMEEDSVSSGDEAILRRLLSLDWMSIPDHVTSLSHIDAEVLVHIIARALQRINNTETQYAGNLPSNIAARHRVCTAFAADIKGLGFKGECGYNQLLYPVEGQTRVLLAWLVKLLPRDQEIRDEESPGPSILLNATITRRLTEWKIASWRNANCAYGVPARNAYSIRPLRTLSVDLKSYNTFDIFCDCARSDISAESSILEKNSLELIEDARYSSLLENNFEVGLLGNTATGGSILNNLPDGVNKARLGDSSKFALRKSKSNELLSNISSIKSDKYLRTSSAIAALDLGDFEAEVAAQQAEECRKKQLFDSLQAEMDSCRQKLNDLKKHRDSIESRISANESELLLLHEDSEALERKALIEKKILEMIPLSAENITKLEDACATIITRTAETSRLWSVQRAPLVESLEAKTKIQTEHHSKCRQAVEEMKNMRDEIISMTSDQKEKEAKSQALLNQVAALPDTLTRAAYTYRILDIVTSLDKQTKGIQKITSDIHVIQKLYNTTASSLERADAVVEEMVFLSASTKSSTLAAEKIESYRKLYNLRLKFKNTIETVEKVGQLEKLSRDLETRIEQESSRSYADAFDRISFDLSKIQEENRTLLLSINSASDR